METTTMTTAEVMRLLEVKAKVLARWDLEGKLVPISKKGKIAHYVDWQVMTLFEAINRIESQDVLLLHLQRVEYIYVPKPLAQKTVAALIQNRAHGSQLEAIVTQRSSEFPQLELTLDAADDFD
jgi:hypothetical protein